MNINLLKLVLLLVNSCIFLSSCIDPYDPGLTANDSKLVVEALLTNQNENHFVQLGRSAAYADEVNSLDKPVNGAVVWVEDKNKVRVDLTDSGLGKYKFPRGFRGVVGNSYQLHIKLIDGTEYISDLEPMIEPPVIEAIKSEFAYDETKEIYDRGSFKISIDTKDPISKGNYYKWNWRHYDPITTCELFSRQNGENGVRWFESKCCEKVCFQVTSCPNCININNDELLNGKLIKSQPIGSIPYESNSPYYLLVDQYAISKKVYEFWKSLKDQTSNVGGIFDTTPALIPGNIYNAKNPNDVAIGFFQVSGVSQKAVYINRAGQTRKPVARNVAITTGDPVPCQACESKDNHTTITPIGL